ncbi:MAG: hypothetical protein IJ600_03430 [Lachnospiraceae bacterium]|nr:hypothetical protein [Lachnospiraceae bacterium]
MYCANTEQKEIDWRELERAKERVRAKRFGVQKAVKEAKAEKPDEHTLYRRKIARESQKRRRGLRQATGHVLDMLQAVGGGRP